MKTQEALAYADLDVRPEAASAGSLRPARSWPRLYDYSFASRPLRNTKAMSEDIYEFPRTLRLTTAFLRSVGSLAVTQTLVGDEFLSGTSARLGAWDAALIVLDDWFVRGPAATGGAPTQVAMPFSASPPLDAVTSMLQGSRPQEIPAPYALPAEVDVRPDTAAATLAFFAGAPEVAAGMGRLVALVDQTWGKAWARRITAEVGEDWDTHAPLLRLYVRGLGDLATDFDREREFGKRLVRELRGFVRPDVVIDVDDG